jgi:hypothetical protein
MATRAQSWLNDWEPHVAKRSVVPKCFVFLANLLLAAPLLAQSQSAANYPMCFPAGNLAVGEVPDKPFNATVVEVEQQVTQARSGVPEGSPVALGILARDSHGRVMGRWKHISADQAPEGNGNRWEITICDPQTGRNTFITYRHQESSWEEPLPLIPNDAQETFARELPPDRRTTVIFGWWHRTVDGRDNLGEETFEGLRAFRYRLTRTPRSDHPIRDVVNSDDLFLQLEQTTWKSYPATEDNLYLTNIKREEPAAGLFEIPGGITVMANPPKVVAP